MTDRTVKQKEIELSFVDAEESTELNSDIDISEALEQKKFKTDDIEFVYKRKPVYDAVKRVFDIIASFFALIILSPVFLIISIAIMADDFANPFFTQARTGKDGKHFKMIKFRSMYKNAEKKREELLDQNEVTGPIFKMKEDPRVTKIGKVLRKSSLDELPQLINIIKGDMSVVGPRPLLTYEQDGCTEHEANRLKVTPGLTCYWQIQKTEEGDFGFLIEKDFEYIKNRSIITDLKIIFKTVAVVFTHKNY